VDYGCNSFCLVVKNKRKFNNLFPFKLKSSSGFSLRLPCKRKGIPQKKKKKLLGRFGNLHSLKKISIDYDEFTALGGLIYSD